jgi:hypothetical protein
MNCRTVSITLMWSDVSAGKCYNMNTFTSLYRFLWAACRWGSEGTSRDAEVISILVSFTTLQHVYSTISHLVTSSRSWQRNRCCRVRLRFARNTQFVLPRVCLNLLSTLVPQNNTFSGVAIQKKGKNASHLCCCLKGKDHLATINMLINGRV